MSNRPVPVHADWTDTLPATLPATANALGTT